MAADMKRGNEMKIKVGSLFDGIGGTPLSAVLSGAEPVWASEIEKVPISITKRHFPKMRHCGDITQINGAEIEPVDIIVGGSPCQDLSVAGKRAGLEGARSGLFMDQVRIVKEMRNATRRETSDRSTELPRPRYMVWENVPGAFSSNGGEDFRAVLEEICKVCDPEVSIPRPPKGKWIQGSGTILGDGYSVAWRVVDAQHWGVPQRRRRIYLVADFGGHTAPEICFEQESVPGDSQEGGETGQRIATDAERSSGSSGELVLNDQGGSVMGVSYGVTGTLRAQEHGHQPIVLNTVDRHAACYNGESITSPTNRQNPKPGDPCHTLGTDSRNYVCYKEPQRACYGISSYASNAMKSSNPHSGIYEADTSRTLDQNGGNPACNQGGIAVVQSLYENHPSDSRVTGPYEVCPTVTRRWGTGGNNVPLVRKSYIVRRLTPLECERLQGYPDGWTALDHEDKPVSDTQRYKALGNSFAVPNALFVISRCVKQLQKEEVNERD